MKSSGCTHQHLGAFVDGELSGAKMLRVSEHLDACPACAEEVRAVREVGELLRGTLTGGPVVPELGGLAGGVVSRFRAEQAQSLWATLSRGVEDWHWVLVGVGSVAAACASALLVILLVQFGPIQQRDDSLAALFKNMDTPAGPLYVWATPVGDSKDPMLMQVDTGADRVRGGGAGSDVEPVQLGLSSESELVGALSEALSRQGRPLDLRGLPESQLSYINALLDNIDPMRASEPSFGPAGPVTVYGVRLVMHMGVTAKTP
jgi:Putative zinc-finger